MFYIQGIWAIPDIVKANPSIKLGVIQFPATNDAKKNKIVSGVDVILTSFRDTPHPKEVARLIAFLTNTANTKTYIKEQFAFPCFKGIVQDDRFWLVLNQSSKVDRSPVLLITFSQQVWVQRILFKPTCKTKIRRSS